MSTEVTSKNWEDDTLPGELASLSIRIGISKIGSIIYHQLFKIKVENKEIGGRKLMELKSKNCRTNLFVHNLYSLL